MGGLKMTVNVSLCGGIPRSELLSCSTQDIRPSSMAYPAQQPQTIPTTTDLVISAAASALRQSNVTKLVLPHASLAEPPSWVVPARGESKLEPIGESRHLQSPVDLTQKACIRFGRSHNSDVQLLHCTSSRKHAILFHHPNGSCYVVDCGSAHGTYVNGKRVQTLLEEGTGTVQPYKVKKGALIRFGGPGAPTYILKAFSIGFDTFVKNLEMAENLTSKKNTGKDPLTKKCASEKENLPRKDSISEFSFDSLVKLNTRLNSTLDVSRNVVILAASRLSQLRENTHTTMKLSKTKRSLESDSMSIQPVLKKRRCASSESIPLTELKDLSMISPEKGRSFSPSFELREITNRPIVSPIPLEIDLSSETSFGLRNLLSLQLPLCQGKKQVKFSEEPPECFYPPTITPDTSDSEEK